MDPHLLVGLVNTEMRNGGFGLTELLKRHDLDEGILCERLASAGYTYQDELEQFRAAGN